MYIDLLSSKQKAKNHKEYLWRLSAIVLFMCAAAVFSGIILLIPSYIFASTKYSLLTEQIQQISTSDVSLREFELRETIRNTNEKIERLDRVVEGEGRALRMLESILSVQAEGIMLTRLMYERLSDGEIKFIVMGEADRRNTLITFRDNLQALDVFTRMHFPTSNLVSERDITFTIELVVDTSPER